MEDRRSFVSHVVENYAEESHQTGVPILGELIDFILEDVLESEAQWEEHAKDPDWFELPVVEHILIQCLRRIDQEKRLKTLTAEELYGIGLPHFISVIRDRWHCPVPFILC